MTDYIKCKKCRGYKKMYKSGKGYSLSNIGGQLVDCPDCLGKGEVKDLEIKVINPSKEYSDNITQIKKTKLAKLVKQTEL